MQNKLAEGSVLTLTAPYDVVSGEGAKVGGIFGVADGDYAEAASGEFHTEGVFELEKTSAQAWTVGEKIYWNDSTKKCDTDSAAGMLVGVATAEAANPSSTGTVKLCGVPDLSEGAQAAVADLAAITGGESPTEAEHNLVITKVNALLAALRLAGIIDA